MCFAKDTDSNPDESISSGGEHPVQGREVAG